jgi:hypothetical protein
VPLEDWADERSPPTIAPPSSVRSLLRCALAQVLAASETVADFGEAVREVVAIARKDHDPLAARASRTIRVLRDHGREFRSVRRIFLG